MNDIEPGVPLGPMDPATEDPRYWERFQARVMAGALPALALRAARPLTIPDVVLSWSRMIVPSSAIAAAVAGFLLLGGPLEEEGLPLFGVEEMLRAEGTAIELPAFLTGPEELDRETLLLAVERGDLLASGGVR
jgi:hypothetical protein